MRALIYDTSGPRSGRLRHVELPAPQPDRGEVRVRVAWSGVNPTDVKARARQRPTPSASVVPNQDGAGVIDRVGEGVAPERLGERVWLYHAAHERQMGTAAEYICVPAHLAVPLPATVGLEQGATVGIPAITAHRCLTMGRGPAGCTVLVTGGAGAVGNAAIQLARWKGATRIVATVSGDRKARVADAAGSDVVLNYRQADFREQLADAAPDGIDVVVDVSIAANLDSYLGSMNAHGAISSYASLGSPLRTEVSPLMRRNIALRFCHVYSTPEDDLRQAVTDVGDALAGEALLPLPLHRFALEDADDAFAACEAGVLGRVILRIGGNEL